VVPGTRPRTADVRPEPRHLILASASPQRRAILAEAGIAFTVRPADVEEATAGDPEAVAQANARLKASAVPGPLVVGADTVVALDGAILGKPRDAAEAREYLGRLNGRTHEVVGGVAVARDGRVVATAVETTRVTFHPLSGEALDAYVELAEWRGRAGGYAIQERGGELLVARVDGDYLNVVGLPLARLRELLR
jgi:septum formation protein